MSLSKKYGVNAAKQNSGVPFKDLPQNDDGTQPVIYVTRAATANPVYRAELDRQMTALRKKNSSAEMSMANALEATLRAFAKVGITGWEFISNADVYGEEDCPNPNGYCDHTAAAAVSLLQNLPDLYEELIAYAAEIKHFQDEDNEAAAGN